MSAVVIDAIAGERRLPVTWRLVQAGGIAAVVAACIIYPFLPGPYDALAMPLSTIAQACAVLAGLFVTPIAVAWLVYESREHARTNRDLSGGGRGYHFALASVIASSLVAVAAMLIAVLSAGISMGLVALALWLAALPRIVRRLKQLRAAPSERFNTAPLHLVVIPVTAILFQFTVATPATEYSRKRAIANAAVLIRELETYHGRHGRYPPSLVAVWKDYHPSVVGMERYQYTPNGDVYDLSFEQPRFLFDNLGAREFVVYNSRDEQMMISHAAWILYWAPGQLVRNQGWYQVHEGPSPHWKYFWFD